MTNTNNIITIRPFHEVDTASILKLNANDVSVLSPMDQERFAQLHSQASQLLVASNPQQEVLAFLMGFKKGKDYDSPNYQWFSKNTEAFFYIDRVVVDVAARGQGIGKKLYQSIYQWATEQSITNIAAEIDIKPPNKASLKFHQDQGFKEVAQQSIHAGSKLVSLQIKSLAD